MINYITIHIKSLYYSLLGKMNLCKCGLTDESCQEEISILKDAIKRTEMLYRKQQGIVKVQISKLKVWTLRVREVGKCDICGSTKKLTAHHLYDKNTHPTLMYQAENGVCLCETCHNGFHKKYTSKSHVIPSMYQKYKIMMQNEILIRNNRQGNDI